MESDLQKFATLRYRDVVAQPHPGPNRMYRATNRYGLDIWIRVYPNRADGTNQGEEEIKNFFPGGPKLHWVRYSEIHSYDFGNLWHLVTQFCPNGSLFSAIVGNIVGQQSMQRMFRGIAHGIADMHKRNLAHRRLSLEVVLLTQNFVPILSKFSAGRKVIPPQKLSATEHPIPLKLHHSPPEMFGQAIHPDANFEYDPYPLDIWQLGVMLFRATNGSYPFGDGDNLAEIHQRQLTRDYHFQDGLAAPLMELIRSMLEPDPAARPTIQQVQAHAWLQ